MIGMVKLFACILIAVVSLVKYIDASCMKYGHSCWGAHGKRNILPPKDIKLDDDKWEMLRFSNGKPMYPFNKLIKPNSQPQRLQFSDGSQQFMLPEISSFYDNTVENILRNSAEDVIDDSGENIQQKKVFPSNKRMNRNLQK